MILCVDTDRSQQAQPLKNLLSVCVKDIGYPLLYYGL